MTSNQKGLAFKRLETDAEIQARAHAVAGHRVFRGCCAITLAAAGPEEAIEAHGVVRRIVEGS